MKISVVTITFHVKTADIMTVRSLTSVSGVVAVEMENGRLTDLMESVNPEVKIIPSEMNKLTLLLREVKVNMPL